MSNNQATYTWSSCPFMEFPINSIFLILFLILCSYFVASITNNLFWVILTLAVLIGSLFPYFIKTKYAFYDTHLVIKYFIFSRNRKYSEFKCFYSDKKGLMLSTFARPRGLDRFRGQSIRYTKNQDERDAVIQFINIKIGNQY